eukprot:1547216-Rhodomonas_salina.1
MLIFIALGGGGVGARLDPGIKHSAVTVISGVRGGATVHHDNNRSSLHASIRQAPQNLKIDPALMEAQPLDRYDS